MKKVLGLVLVGLLCLPSAAVAGITDFYGVWEVQFDIGNVRSSGYQFRIDDVAYNNLESINVPWKTHRPIWESDGNSNAGSQNMDYMYARSATNYYYYEQEINGGAYKVQTWADFREGNHFDIDVQLLKDNPSGGWYYNQNLSIEGDLNGSTAHVTAQYTDWTTRRTYEAEGDLKRVCDFSY